MPLAVAVVISVLLLAACGGGGGGGGTSMQPPHTGDDLPENYRKFSVTLGNELHAAPSSYTNTERQHGIRSIGADVAHWTAIDTTGGVTTYLRGGGVTVAIFDTMVDIDHVDLSANIVTVAEHDLSTIQADVHGTHVAGIIAALLNEEGVVGVAPEAKILPIHWDDDTIDITTAYNLVLNYNAFVVNNSWGPSPIIVTVTVDSTLPLLNLTTGNPTLNTVSHVIIPIPNHWYMDGTRITRDNFPDNYKRIPEAAANNDILIVFAQGNEGWNSENGRFLVLDAETTMGIALLDVSRVDTRFTIIANMIPFVTVTVSRNFPDHLVYAPIYFPEAASNWLNVVAVDENHVIATWSNGCGETKGFCLAAPGVSITSTTPNGNYEGFSGTSASAPHVSGAAALLKGMFPNLSAKNVQHILLNSADGAGTCGGETSKLTVCVDDVYGHGILNVSASFMPTSFIDVAALSTSASGTDIGQRYSLADTRIALSPVFAGAPWQAEELSIGGLDNYGRVFYTHIDLSNGVWVTTPIIAGGEVDGAQVHAAYAPPLARQAVYGADIHAADAAVSALRFSGRDGQGAYGIESYGAYQSRYLQHDSSIGSVAWHYRTGAAEWSAARQTAHFWQTPFTAAPVHELHYTLPLVQGSDGSGDGGWGQFGLVMGSGGGVEQAALRWRGTGGAGSEASHGAGGEIQLEGGLITERDSVLGADFSGGFAVKNTRTHYGRIAGGYTFGGGAHVFADYVRGYSRAQADGGILSGLSAQVDSWSAGMAWDNWRLVLSQPLVITRGSMDLSYISGYDYDSGDYRETHRTLDLSAGRRESRLSLQYSGGNPERGRGYIFAADYLHNAPSRRYRADEVRLSAAFRYVF